MSDPRVDSRAIEHKYGLHGNQVWSVSPVWQLEARGKQLLTLDNAGPAGAVVEEVAGFFEARTMAEHLAAVELVGDELLWDAPDICFTRKDHLRMASYIFKGLAQPRLVPTVLAVSQPHGAPGCHLIELDGVYVVASHKPWFLPITWLLPDTVPNNLHMKIGVNGSLEEGKIELMIARFTNQLGPVPPLRWQRGLIGMALGAVPCAFEGLLGFLFDAVDGSDYYARKRSELFRQRHPTTTNPTLDWLGDVVVDMGQWLVQQGTAVLESALAVTQSCFGGIAGMVWGVLHFYLGLLSTALGLAQQVFAAVTGPSPIMSRTCISLQVWELQTTLSSLTSMLCSTTTPLPLVHSTTQQHTTWHTAQHTAQRTRQGMLR